MHLYLPIVSVFECWQFWMAPTTKTESSRFTAMSFSDWSWNLMLINIILYGLLSVWVDLWTTEHKSSSNSLKDSRILVKKELKNTPILRVSLKALHIIQNSTSIVRSNRSVELEKENKEWPDNLARYNNQTASNTIL